MKERICTIWSKDEQYSLRLADYINSKKLLPFKVLVFTDWQALIDCESMYDMKLLIMDGDEEVPTEICCEAVVRLSENEEDGCICRYQPADRLAKVIISYMPDYVTGPKSENRKGCINSVYSPATKCFKTTLAIGLGLWSAKKERSLYINLEEFSGLDEAVFKKSGGLSQALYYFKSQGEKSIGKILACTDQIFDMDYFYPVTCPEDISELTDTEMVRFINAISDSGLYQSIWIDIGNTYNIPWNIMELSDRVLVPEPLDYVGRKKVSQMENYLVSSGRTNLLSRIEKINIPYDSSAAGYEINPEWILKPENRTVYNRILGEV